jgi:DNA polymerase III delta prime subunit
MLPTWIQALPSNLHTPLRGLWMAHKNNQLPQVVLFSGPQGAGQNLAALSLARYLSCEASQGSTSPEPGLFGDLDLPSPSLEAPCGQCFSCRTTHNRPDWDGTNPWSFVMPLKGQSGQGRKDREDRAQKLSDLGKNLCLEPWSEVWEQGSSHNVDSARDLMESFRLGADKARVILIIAAEKMNEHAANALLKTLEEAPPNTWFLLTTSAQGQLLPTILSRCLKVPIAGLDFPSFQELLQTQEPNSADEENTTLLFALSEGCWGLARSWIARDLKGLRQNVFSFLDALGQNRMRPISLWLSQASLSDKERCEQFLQLLYLVCGDLVAVRAGILPRNRDVVDRLQQLSPRIPAGLEQNILSLIQKSLDRHKRHMPVTINLMSLGTEWLVLLQENKK